MKQQITLREANQHLSRYIEAATQGNEVVITKRGKPVAKLVPITAEQTVTPERQAAWEKLQSSASGLNIDKFDRDACYER
ncbi:MAG TPA: type II toxin-antitoxin system prevent-host-death family antitoxin [Sulfuricella sp.]|nr:type II toxin-antitoxin system prevent-host-death family antitoxin [Sulfuricella sp.]